ncbi:MAG: glycoside hydrolase family 127 protein [Oscillospiraceae bacterium]|nr:glycoside hydrolase family 127 protein [Oscillospiraceae bacterium]
MPNQIELKDVKITGGYFHEKQQMNEKVTIPATYKQFYSTGRIDAFKLKWRNGQANQPHIFWDSDVAKWIEGAAYTLIHKRDENLESLIDSVVADLVAGQTPEGYFNSYYQTIEFSNRFTNRNNHELYCAGHLIEGAVAYKQATGKDSFLNAMCRYADYIEKVFTDPGRDKNFRTPGHEEIELALVKLCHETGNKKYLDLSRFFIATRGTLDGEKQTNANWASSSYAQDHLPIADQTTAEGHAVRCLYMFSGAADIAREFNNEKLKKACETVFNNIVSKRMYVTGGIGGNYSGEAFSYDYDLPNELAYTETCASIAMIFFCQRMYLLTGDKKYMDAIELQLYNAVLSGISLYGDRFFYCNPLEVHPERRDYFTKIHNSQFAPEYERPEYFGCSCCPPNVIRLIASLGQYMYHVDNDNDGEKIYVNLYNSSEFEYNGVKIIQETDYPRNGEVKFTVTTNKPVELILRSPAWCHNINIDTPDDSEEEEEYYDEKTEFNSMDTGNYSFKIKEAGEYKLSLNFAMPVVELYANPKVHYCAGRIAVKRGPVVYCAESIDNGENLKSVAINKIPDYKCEQSQIGGNNIVKIKCDAEFVSDNPENSDDLYSEKPFKSEKKRLALIPYAAWANRGRSEMLVWFLKNRE